MSTVEAVDVSVYTGEVAPTRWSRAQHNGVGLAIVGAWHGSRANKYAEQQLRDARAAKIATAAYVVLGFGRSGTEAVNSAAAASGDEWSHLKFVALDCEVPSLTAQEIRDAAKRLTDTHQKPILYTYWKFWHDTFSNRNDWAHLPLWDARPDHDNSALAWGHHAPYGGWTKRTGKQYKADDSSLGFLCDRSIFDRNIITGETS